eukprot:TRINITY_DN1196_c0_g2_i2.p1 TRINITY_DN1196_c0_g2~~TRINITY_DN1196_c0_g2_i2.p1  ORF type:complete len:268 (+),score=53.60 TRINITY_DN1196_c0_g2_i2:31-834(+)
MCAHKQRSALQSNNMLYVKLGAPIDYDSYSHSLSVPTIGLARDLSNTLPYFLAEEFNAIDDISIEAAIDAVDDINTTVNVVDTDLDTNVAIATVIATDTEIDVDAISKSELSQVGAKKFVDEPSPLGCSPDSDNNCTSISTEVDYTDVTFFVRNCAIPAHKVIVSARSKYFRALFLNGMKESGTSEISIDSCDTRTFRIILNWMYTDQLCIPVKWRKENHQSIENSSVWKLWQITTFNHKAVVSYRSHIDLLNLLRRDSKDCNTLIC